MICSELGANVLPVTVRIYYGGKVHFLCTRASAQEVRGIMNKMASVVDAMLQRLDVDLAGDQVAVALEAFNLACWAHQDQRRRLADLMLQVCKLLRLRNFAQGVARSLCLMTKTLASLRPQVLHVLPAADNRFLWSWAVAPQWRAKYARQVPWCPKCDEVVGFFAALKVNTTTLERDLGHLLNKLQAHSGPLAADGATISAILEVAIEGPQTEAEVFAPAAEEGGQLGLTPFSRLCANLWVAHFERRFRYAKGTGNRAQGPPAKKHPKPGTWAAAQHARACLTSRIARQAGSNQEASSFVPDLMLPLTPVPSLSGTRWAPDAAPPKDPLRQFKLQTQRKRSRYLANLVYFLVESDSNLA